MSVKDLQEKYGISDKEIEDDVEKMRANIKAYKLREARKASCLSQKQVAEKMGVSQARISKMENGDIASISFENICRYIEALGGVAHISAELPTGQVAIV